MKPYCPTCHRPLATPKRTTLHTVQTTNLRDLDPSALFAYYKRTAPLEDLRFWIRHAGLSPELRAGFLALETAAANVTIPRAAFYRQLTALQDQWRRESNARDRQAQFDDGSLIAVPAVFEKSA